MTTDYLAEMVADVRSHLSVTPGQLTISDPLVRSLLAHQVNLVSRYQPRINQRVEVMIHTGDSVAVLPDNFLSAKLGDLYYLKTGEILLETIYPELFLNTLGWAGGSFRAGPADLAHYGRFNAEGLVLARGLFRHATTLQDTIELTTTDTGRYGLLLAETATADRTTKGFVYTARHEVTNAKNTLPLALRDIVVDLTIKELLLSMARQYRQKAAFAQNIQEARAANEAAKGLEEQAKEFGRSLGQIAPLGDAA
jgi:hypothetical protein